MSGEEKTGVIFLYKYEELLKMLPPEEQGKILMASIAYDKTGETAKFDNSATQMLFAMMKQDFDRMKEKRYLGKRHWNWKGGISKENHVVRTSSKYNQWRKSVFIKDKYTCRKCRQRGGILHAHHVKKFSEFPELRFDVENGVTLCKKCHNAVHSKGGEKNEK